MRKSIIGLLVTASVVGVATASVAPLHLSSPTLHVGSPAPKIEVGKWVKGTPVTQFKKGHVYVVEFWATWCPPCREAIPHMTELAKKYKKITFIGVSIAENNQAAVAPFVKMMGSKMVYHVAMDKQKSPTRGEGYMSDHWMVAAQQDGIPTAFIIGKDEHIKWIGSPFSIAPVLSKISKS